MATISYQETGNLSTFNSVITSNVFCSSATTNISSNALAHDATVGGAAGVGSSSGTAGSSAVGVLCAWSITPAVGVFWNAGTWTVRVNITTANANLTITSCAVCRLNSSFVNQQTIGNATGLSVSCGTTGVKTLSVTGVAGSNSAGDLVAIMVVFTNGSMSAQTFAVSSNQIIDSPFDTVGPGVVIDEDFVRLSLFEESRIISVWQ